MGYLENNLGKDERVLARVTHSKAGLISAFLGLTFCVALAVALGLLIKFIMGLSGALDSTLSMVTMVITILSIIIAIVIGLCGILCCISAAVKISCDQLIVTNKRLLGRTGFIAKKTVDIILLKLDTVNASNSIFGALLHYGTLEVVSAGSQQIVNGNTVNMKFPYIKNTEEFRRAVLAAIDKAKDEDREAQAEAQAAALKRARENIEA